MKAFLAHCLLAVSCYGAVADGGPPVLEDLPATVGEVRAAAQAHPELANWARSSEVLTSGIQTMLADPPPQILALPEFAWAPKLAGGPVKMLVISTLTHEGQVRGLASAMALDLTLVSAPHPTAYKYLNAPGALDFIVKRVKKKLQQEYDVILLTLSASALPKEIHQAILSKVQSGAGLVLCGLSYYGWDGTWWSKHYATAAPLAGNGGERHRVENPAGITTPNQAAFGGIPWAALPPIGLFAKSRLANGATAAWRTADGLPLVGCRNEGKGRIVAFGWLGMSAAVGRYMNKPNAENDLFLGIRRHERYRMGATAKAILWAAGRAPRARATVAMKEAIPSGKENKILIRVKGDRGTISRVRVTLRDEDFRTVFEATPPVRKPAVRIALPPLPAGAFVLEASLIGTDGAVIHWTSKAFVAESDVTFEASLEKESFLPGQTAMLSGRVQGGGGDRKVRIEVRGVRRRLLDRAEIKPAADGTFRWGYRMIRTRLALQKAELTLLVDGKPVAKRRLPLSCAGFAWDDFHNVLWGGSYIPYVSTRMYEKARRHLGMDSFVAPGHPMHEHYNRIGVEAGLLPFWTNWYPLSPTALETDYKRTVAQLESRVSESHEWLNRYGGIAVAVQDERHGMKDPGKASPQVLAKFREYLRSRYKSVQDLNKAWGTTFADFGKVVPLRSKDFKADQRNLAPWLEYRLFFSKLTVDVDRTYRDKTLAGLLDKKPYYGIEGLFGLGGHIIPFSGFDYAAHAEVFSLMMPYPRAQVNLTRSFCRGPILTWRGYGNDPAEYFTTPWWGLLHGYWGMGWFCGHTFMHEFGPFFRQSRWIRDATDPLRRGVGKLVMGLEDDPDPVVFLYSQSSLYAASIMGHWINPDNTHLFNRPCLWAMANLQTLLAESGLQHRYASEKQVQAGALGGKKLLVLSSCFAMAPETCRAIEQWVAQGGTVVADLRPAVFDDRGVPSGGLDKLFGVASKPFRWSLAPFDYLVWAKGDIPEFRLNSWLVGEYYEGDLKVADGKALGEHIFSEGGVNAPAFVLKKTGKGRAMLLNFLETAYGRKREHWQRDMISEILRMAGVKAALRPVDKDGAALWDHEITRFHDGNARYVGLFRMETAHAQLPENVYVPFDTKAHTYIVGGVDPVRRKTLGSKYLGFVGRAGFPLVAGGVTIVARLPYRVTGLDADVERAGRLRQGTVVRIGLATKGDAPVARHVVHAQVFDPDGNEDLDLTQNVVLKKGKGTLRLGIPLDAPGGTWTVKLREIVSGQSATARFRIR